MKLLVLGGTRFVGYHMVAEALARGHEVTIFHRGQSGEAPAGVESLLGDRRGDLAPLAGRRWDAVLDTCAYVPAAVEATGKFLADAVDHYAFVSTISVYAPPPRPGLDESQLALKGPPDDPTTETISGATYGPLKVLCERAIERWFPGRSTLIRPGIVAGPRDATDRFTAWVVRVARGGDVLAPGPGDRPVQFIDARDLAAWTLLALERRLAGPVHVVGPAEPLTMAGLLAGIREATRSTGRTVWADADFLAAEGAPALELDRDFPFWTGPDDRALFALDPARAIATGLACRPLADTVADTLAWFAGDRPDGRLRIELPAGLEARLIARWEARTNTT